MIWFPKNLNKHEVFGTGTTKLLYLYGIFRNYGIEGHDTNDRKISK